MKTFRGRGAKTYKGYLVIFVCFATSALHLEAATDYSTDGFLAAYRRFIGRRGSCSSITSDCGTNFIGADKELQRMFGSASRELKELAKIIANDGTQWKFNPPATPHFGGKWEAAVKSTKFHLRRVIGDTVLTYEELATLLSQIEAVLNSRPLCAMSEDPTDLVPLTPGHFLIGDAMNAVPEPTLLSERLSYLAMAAYSTNGGIILGALGCRILASIAYGIVEMAQTTTSRQNRSPSSGKGRTTSANEVGTGTSHGSASRTGRNRPSRNSENRNLDDETADYETLFVTCLVRLRLNLQVNP